MHYYVDGYNLIFRTLSGGESLQQRRERLISELNEKSEWLKLSITLVFDSQYQKSDSTRHHYKTLEIYYTDEKETADDYIIRVLKQHTEKEQLTVVTSDQLLAWRARREGAITLSSEEFIGMLKRRAKNKFDHVKRELRAPPVQKVDLPELLPEPLPKKKRGVVIRQKADEYYLEKFEAFEEGESEVKDSEEKKSTLKAHPKKEVKPAKQKKYESDHDRWLREFTREE